MGHVITLLAVCLIGVIALVGCGSSVDHAPRKGGSNRHEPAFLYAMTHGLVLVRGRLPDGGFFVIVVKPCLSGHCHELDEYVEEPARYSGVPHSSGLVKEGGVTGPAITPGALGANPRERSLMALNGSGACAGPYRYALDYGILYLEGASVTAHADGRTVKFKKVRLPARLHERGVLVYALLLPGKNERVVRAPDGRVVARESAYGPKAKASCSK